MKLLLDTQLLLWAVGYPERLSPSATALLESPQSDLFFSVASVWEIAIKHGLGSKDFQVPPGLFRDALLENGYKELPILGTHAVAIGKLPPIHKNPFDRILIAQALVEGISLLTADGVVAQYPGPIRKV